MAGTAWDVSAEWKLVGETPPFPAYGRGISRLAPVADILPYTTHFVSLKPPAVKGIAASLGNVIGAL